MFLSRSQITRESFGSPPPDHVALQGRAFVRYPDTPDWILIENHSSFCARDPDEKEFGYPLCPHLFGGSRSEEHTSELQSRGHLVCRLLLEKKKKKDTQTVCMNNKTVQ